MVLRIFCCVRSLNIWLSVNISISNRMKYGQKNATPSSQQISLDGQFNEIDIELSYNVVLILLCCKHVLVNYFYSNRKLMRLIKLSPEVAKEMVDLRQKSAAWIKETTSLFSEDGIKVLKDYKRYWVFKK